MKQSLFFWRLIMLIATMLSLSTLGRILQVTSALNISIMQMKWLIFLCFFSFVTLLEIVFLCLTWNKRVQSFIGTLDEFSLRQPALRMCCSILFVLLVGLYAWLVLFSPMRGFLMGDIAGSVIALGPQNGTLRIVDVIRGVIENTRPFTGRLINSGLQWWLFWICSLAAGVVLKISHKGVSLSQAFLTAVLGQTLVFKLLSYLPTITSYPFSLVWSEGSRWYYASLFLSQKLYGQVLSPSIIDIPLNILNAAPFFLGISSIWVFRLWSVLLSLGMAVASVLLLARRLRIADRLQRGMFIALCFLYLFQEGSIYPHLLLAIAAVLWGTSASKPWRTLFIVLLASFWVGMDRINWYPVPGMLAAALYLLEEPIHPRRDLIQYMLPPVLWVLCGVAAAILGGIARMWITGTDLRTFGSALASPLLWYRLLPNPTYQYGVLPAILFVSFPLWLVLAWSLRKPSWHNLRLLGLGTIILVLFAGGLVASIKIGGGGDLHNMDAYMILLLIIGGYVYFQRFTSDRSGAAGSLPWQVVILAVAFPAILGLQSAQLGVPFDRQGVQNDLQVLNSYVKQASGKGDVLFISQRQLITFGAVSGAPLTPDYEIVTLMEMVMSGNQPYLDQFQNDLRSQRFSLIVVEPQNMRTESSRYPFGEENDVWVQQVSAPLLCSYESAATVPVAGVEVFTPQQNPASCP